jgi:hypothetical protein
MTTGLKTFPPHACQLCGSETKLVETLIDDEFIWNNKLSIYESVSFTDCFEHTGNERCSVCGEEWTGVYETK